MRKLFFCLLAALSVPGWADITLVRDGIPVSVIVLHPKATKSAQLGAAELQHHVKLITGAELPVVSTPDPAKVNIFIGGNNEGIKDETSVMRFENGNIFLTGNDSPDFEKVNYAKPETFPSFEFKYNGSLWAVYDFLELCCGVRFYGMTETDTVYTARKDLTVKEVNRTYTPKLDAFREVYPDDYHSKGVKVTPRELALWKLRWRMSCFYGRTNHNMESIFFYYYKPAKTKHLAPVFIESRPQYFAKGYEGLGAGLGDWLLAMNYPADKDVPPQLCYTDPGVSDWYAREVLEYAQGRNVKGGFGNKVGTVSTDLTTLPRLEGKPFFYPIEGGDNGNFCKCADCRKFLREANNASVLKFKLMSEIARKAAMKDPGAGVSTLAYIQSLYYPEGVKLPDNLSVQLCLTVYSWWHPEAYRLQHGEYRKWIQNEVKKRPLTLWTYLFSSAWDARIHFGKYHPFPTFYPWKTAEMFKEFTSDGIHGWFTEVEMRYNTLEAYIAARVCYDPSVNTDALINEYFNLFYGPAGNTMKEFYQEVEKAFWNPENCPKEWLKEPNVFRGPYGVKHPFWGTGLISPEICWKTIGTPERMAKLKQLVSEACVKKLTPLEKKRLDIFLNTVWEPALRGEAEYKQNSKAENASSSAIRLIQNANGDPSTVNWADADIFRMSDPLGIAKTSDRFSLAADREHLYFRYETEKNFGGRGLVQFCFGSPDGKKMQTVCIRQKLLAPQSSPELKPVALRSEESDGGWKFQGAVRIADLPFENGVVKANVVRQAGSSAETEEEVAVWQPTWYSREYSSPQYFSFLCQTPCVIQDNAFTLEGKAVLLSDPAASDGRAGRMDASQGWTMKYFIPTALCGTREVVIALRTDITDPKAVFQIGAFDKFNRKAILAKQVKASEYAGSTYRDFSLGKVNLIPGSYIYFSSLTPKPGNDESKYYFVDMIIIK